MAVRGFPEVAAIRHFAAFGFTIIYRLFMLHNGSLMFAGNRATLSTILLIFLMFYPHVADAETFKSREFLTWSEPSQDLYIHTSVSMAGLLAAKNDEKHGDCIENWYFDDETAANDFIRETMNRFPDYHPRGVIVAVLEKRCGTFDYSAR